VPEQDGLYPVAERRRLAVERCLVVPDHLVAEHRRALEHHLVAEHRLDGVHHWAEGFHRGGTAGDYPLPEACTAVLVWLQDGYPEIPLSSDER